jgi:nucleotide-binding universal stress UspA family protein
MHRLEQRLRAKANAAPHPLRHGSYSRICVAVDNSPAAGKAVLLAISLVRGNKRAELTFCHVIDISRLVARTDRSLDDYGLSFETADESARIVLARCCFLARQAGVFARSYIRQGRPATEASSFAKTIGADLMVIGNSPAKKMHRLLNGSVRDDMVQACSLPLLVATADSVRPADFRPRCILVPGADSPAAIRAKRVAAELATDFSAQLILLPGARGGTSEESSTIDRAVSEHHPGLIVMAAAPRRRVRNIFADDVVERVMQEANVPLLIVATAGTGES